MGGIQKQLAILLFLTILLIPAVQGTAFKNAQWKNSTFLELSMDSWTTIPQDNFHAYNADKETRLSYCRQKPEECRPLWRLALESIGVTDPVLGWYKNENEQGECDNGVCSKYLSEDEKEILEKQGFAEYCDTAWSYPCSGLGSTYTQCMDCISSQVTDCEYGKWRWEVKCQGTCSWNGYTGIQPCELLDNFCFDHRQEVEVEDTCTHQKDTLTADDLNALYNKTRCWIHTTQLRESGNNYVKHVLVEGEPAIKDNHLSCLINYTDWQNKTLHNNKAADQIGPGSKTYFDFQGKNLSLGIECEKNSDCGENYWTGEPECCNGDGWSICTAYHGYECRNPGTQESFCFEYDGYKQTEECTDGCENNTCITAEDQATPINSTNSTDPEIDMINCSVIALHGIETIDIIQDQLAQAASSSDAEVAGTTMETAECFTDVLLNTLPLHSTNEYSDDFIRDFLEIVISNCLNATFAPVFNEQGFETVVTDFAIPQINAAKQKIQNQSFNEIPDTDFVNDAIAYIDLQADAAIKQREKIDFAIDSANLMKLTMRVTKFAADAARIWLLGKTEFKTIGLAELVENTNEIHMDAEECTLEGITQPKINYVLTLFMRNFVGNTPYYVQEVEKTVSHLNSMTEHPSINVSNAAHIGNATVPNFLSDIFVTNTYEKELKVNTQLYVDTQIQGYCNGLTPKTGVPVEPLIKWVYNTISPGDTEEINLTTPVYFMEEINRLNLEDYCIARSDCSATNSDREVKVEGSGTIYVFYGERKLFAVKSLPVKRVFKVHDCEALKPRKTAVSSGGGGGGGGSRSSAPAAAPTPVSAPAAGGFGGWNGDFEEESTPIESKPAEKQEETKTEPVQEVQKETIKQEPKKSAKEEPKKTILFEEVKSIFKKIFSWLHFFI